MAETQTWRIDTGDRVREVVVTSVHRGLWRCEDGPRETSPVAAVRAYAHFDGCGGMAVAPGEMTRGELVAQLATATASVQQLRADVELATAQRDAEACHRDDADAEAERVTRELAVLRAQLAPLLAVHDALVAAAALPGAGASPEAMVAAVRAQGAEEMRAKVLSATVLCTRACEASLKSGTMDERIRALLEVVASAHDLWVDLPIPGAEVSR